MSDLEEVEVIETALGCFESPSNSFYLSPGMDEGFRLSGSRDSRISEVGDHEIKFRAHEEIYPLGRCQESLEQCS